MTNNPAIDSFHHYRSFPASVPMRDGVELATDVYVPEGEEGP